MTISRWSWLLALALSLVPLSGCDKSPEPLPADKPVPTDTASGSTTSAAAPISVGSAWGDDYADTAVPVPGDFEDAAEKAVTKDNYKDKLAELDAAVSAAAGPDGSAVPEGSAAPSASAAPAPPAAPPPPPAPAPAPAP